jgi:hypothetical protein
MHAMRRRFGPFESHAPVNQKVSFQGHLIGRTVLLGDYHKSSPEAGFDRCGSLFGRLQKDQLGVRETTHQSHPNSETYRFHFINIVEVANDQWDFCGSRGPQPFVSS